MGFIFAILIVLFFLAVVLFLLFCGAIIVLDMISPAPKEPMVDWDGYERLREENDD